MANRTYKIYGQAYAPSGSVSATVTVNGAQVFNGTVPTSDTPRDGVPGSNTELLSFDLDEAVTSLSVSAVVSGGELCWGSTITNGGTDHRIAVNYADSIADKTNLTADEQTAIAAIGEANLGTTLYNALTAGTLTNPTAEQQTAIANANKFIDWSNDYVHAPSVLTNPQVNGSAWPNWDSDTMGDGSVFILADGDTLTYNWTLDPTACTKVA